MNEAQVAQKMASTSMPRIFDFPDVKSLPFAKQADVLMEYVRNHQISAHASYLAVAAALSVTYNLKLYTVGTNFPGTAKGFLEYLHSKKILLSKRQVFNCVDMFDTYNRFAGTKEGDEVLALAAHLGPEVMEACLFYVQNADAPQCVEILQFAQENDDLDLLEDRLSKKYGLSPADIERIQAARQKHHKHSDLDGDSKTRKLYSTVCTFLKEKGGALLKHAGDEIFIPRRESLGESREQALKVLHGEMAVKFGLDQTAETDEVYERIMEIAGQSLHSK